MQGILVHATAMPPSYNSLSLPWWRTAEIVCGGGKKKEGGKREKRRGGFAVISLLGFIIALAQSLYSQRPHPYRIDAPKTRGMDGRGGKGGRGEKRKKKKDKIEKKKTVLTRRFSPQTGSLLRLDS